MQHIHTFAEHERLDEMKAFSRQTLEIFIRLVGQRMQVNPKGLPVTQLSRPMKRGLQLALSKKFAFVYTDDKGTERILLCQHGRGLATHEENPIPRPAVKLGGDRVTDSTFLLDRGEFRRVARTLPKADYILAKINAITIGDVEALNKLRSAVYSYYGIK